MRTTVNQSTASCLANSGDSTIPMLARALRQAIKQARWIDEQGVLREWKDEAVAAAIGIDKSTLSKVLAGTKPLRAIYIDKLPVEVRRELSRVMAAADGLSVCAPATASESIVLLQRVLGQLQHEARA